LEFNNFSKFIKDNKKFFLKYKDKFIKTLLEFISKSSPNIKLNNSFKEELELFYNSLFIEPFMEEGKSVNFDFVLFDINYKSILNKLFVIMANSYIKDTINGENNVEKLLNFIKLCDFYINYLTEYKEKTCICEEIPKEITYLFNKQKPVIYLTVFRGVPISYKTSIDNIDEENQEIVLQINSYQLIASKFQNKAYIIDPKSAKAFTASIKDVDQESKEVILYNFISTKRENIKRNYIRVQPLNMVNVNMFYKNNLYNGTIYDISLKGVAILSKPIKDANISDKFELEIKIFFNNQLVDLTVDAELVSISKISQMQYKYHFYFGLSLKEESMLEKYIVYREKEIIKELNDYIKNTLL